MDRNCDILTDCKQIECGEAACYCNAFTDRPACLCPETGKEPIDLKCPMLTSADINVSEIVRAPSVNDSQILSSAYNHDSGTIPCDHNITRTTMIKLCRNFPCGEGGCYCNAITSRLACICPNGKEPIDLKCPALTSDPFSAAMQEPKESLESVVKDIEIAPAPSIKDSQILSSAYNHDTEPIPCDNNAPRPIITKLCLNFPCGEAGCYCNPVTGRLGCMCTNNGKAPVDGRCDFQAEQVINSNDTVKMPPGNFPFAPPGSSDGKNRSGYGDNGDPLRNYTYDNSFNGDGIIRRLDSFHLMKQVAAPIGSVALIFIVFSVIILIWRQKTKKRKKRKPAGQVISWLQRADQVHLLENMNVVGKNPLYVGADKISEQLNGIETIHIPQSRIKLMTVIGEGAFGKVFKGSVTWSEGDTSLVAVKILKEDASNETREDFTREVKIVSSFNHENILKLVGVVTIENECPYMVFEFMEFGDLTELLRSNDPSNPKPAPLILKQTELVEIATQIANGMTYLALKHFVHRDLATRNCLVGNGLIVKISDFGMSRDIYTNDYYKIGGSRMLPVRWMSPESIKYGRFTNESDVWSFGVVLWEIFSYGKQPYFGHTNEEVISFIHDNILLQRPEQCPDTIYAVMLGCWRKNSKDRFIFEKIYKHLKEYYTKICSCYNQNNIEGDVALTIVEES